MHAFCGWSKVIQVLFNYYLTSLVKQQEGQLACKNLLHPVIKGSDLPM